MSETDAPIAPPVAEQRPHTFAHHGMEVADPYHWLRDESYPSVDDADVLAYLEAENRYFEAVMEPHQDLTEALFEEIKARQKPDDESVPVKDGDYFYQWRFAPGAEYRTWARWPVAQPDAVETVLDETALAEGHEFFDLGAFSVSHDGRYLAYSTDTSGAERYTMFVKDLASGVVLPETMENTLGDAVWAADDRTFFYRVSNENWRSYQVRRHAVGESAERDQVVYEEPDSGFWIDLGEASSKRYVIISTGDQVTNEAYLLASGDPHGEPALVAARRVGHEYDIDHQGDRFIVRSNDAHKNFRLATTPANDFRESAWTTLIEGSRGHLPARLAVLRPMDSRRGARRRHRSGARPRPGRRATSHRPSRKRLQRRTRCQRRVPHRRGPAVVRVHGYARYRIRLRHEHRRSCRQEGPRDTQRLRRGPVPHVPHRGTGAGRGVGARVHRAPEGHAPRRQRAAVPLRLRGVRARHCAIVFHQPDFDSRPRFHLRHRACPGRYGTRARLV